MVRHKYEYLLFSANTDGPKGWKAIRTENKPIMIIFFMMGGIVIAAWGVMFASAVYRMVFLEWPFFAALTCTSFVFLGATLILAVICFLNFGHGLAHYREITFITANVV